MNYETTQTPFQVHSSIVTDDYMPSRAVMDNETGPFHNNECFNGSIDLDVLADYHSEILGVLSSQDEEENEEPKNNACLLKDSPLQAFLRTKNMEGSQSTALTSMESTHLTIESMASTHHTRGMTSTQHTLNTENDTWCGASSHDVDDDESVYSFAPEDLWEPSNSFEPKEDCCLAFADHAKGSSGSLDFEQCVFSFNDDDDDDEETTEPPGLRFNDSMSSLNEAFENLNKCMERTAHTRALLKQLPDRPLLSKGNSAQSFNVSRHSVGSFNSSFTSGDSSASSLLRTTSRNQRTTVVSDRLNASWSHPKSDAGWNRRRVHSRLPSTKSKATHVIKDRRMIHSGLVKSRVDSKHVLVSSGSQDSLCSTGSLSNRKGSSSARLGRRSLISKDLSIKRSAHKLTSRAADTTKRNIPASLHEALKLLETDDIMSSI